MTTKKTPAKRTDINQNVKRIFDEMIERSETPTNRGNIRAVPTPGKKRGTAKSK